MLKKFIVIVSCVVFSSYLNGKEVTFRLEEGTLKMSDLLAACKDIANSKTSKLVDKSIAGKVISINGTPYEVRYFSFEDTSGKIAPNTTFADYIKTNKLEDLKSASTKPLPGIAFESFDFRRSHLKDGVYFSMAVRKIENGDDQTPSPKT